MGNNNSTEVIDTENDEDEEMLRALIPVILAAICSDEHEGPKPQSTSILTGNMRLREILDGNPNTFRSIARMDKPTFQRLLNILKTYGEFEQRFNFC